MSNGLLSSIEDGCGDILLDIESVFVELYLFICFSSYFHPSVLSSDIFIIGSVTIFGFCMVVVVLAPADLFAVVVLMPVYRI